MANETKQYVTLVANVAQTITLAGRGPVRVVCLANPADIYWRADGTAATVKGVNNNVCPAGAVSEEDIPDRDGSISVSIISAGTPDVGVQLFSRVQGG